MKKITIILAGFLLIACQERQQTTTERINFGPFFFQDGQIPTNPIDFFTISENNGTIVSFGAVIIVTQDIQSNKLRLLHYNADNLEQVWAIDSLIVISGGVHIIKRILTDEERIAVYKDEIIGIDLFILNIDSGGFGTVSPFIDIERQ
jgi:hypothetical protein